MSVDAGRWDQTGEGVQEFEGREGKEGATVGGGAGRPVEDLADAGVIGPPFRLPPDAQPVEGEHRPGAVAKESLAAGAVGAVDARRRRDWRSVAGRAARGRLRSAQRPDENLTPSRPGLAITVRSGQSDVVPGARALIRVEAYRQRTAAAQAGDPAWASPSGEPPAGPSVSGEPSPEWQSRPRELRPKSEPLGHKGLRPGRQRSCRLIARSAARWSGRGRRHVGSETVTVRTRCAAA